MPRIAKNSDVTGTKWYDDLCILYQRTGISSLRNILWEQVKGLVYGRIHEFIRERNTYLRYDKDLCEKLFQESFFIFVKAADIWDKERKTKFITFLGDILDQEIMNIIRLEHYHRNRDKKIEVKIKDKQPPKTSYTQHDNFVDKKELVDEIAVLMEHFPFIDIMERDVVHTIIYGEMGDWSKLKKRLGISIGKLYKIRGKAVIRMRVYLKENCTERLKEIMGEVIGEK